MSYVASESRSPVCQSAAGTFVRSASSFNGRPFFISSGTTPYFIYHLNSTSNEWRLSTSAGSIGTEVCDFSSGATQRDDATMGPTEWASTSGELVTISCSAENANCFRNGTRSAGCSCEFTINGGTQVSDPSICSSGCCRSGTCQQTQAYCLRFVIIGFVVGVLVLLMLLMLLWRPKHGLMQHKVRRVTPDASSSVEQVQRSKWEAEVSTAASRGHVVTWWAYGENAEVPAMEIYELKAARIGVEHPSVLDPIELLVQLRKRLEMGGLSFRYTADAFGDDSMLCESHPLVITYVPYTKNIELPKLKKQSSSASVGVEVAAEIQKRSRKSVPAVAAMIRRTSNGGFVNGWPVIRPETGAPFDDPFDREGGAVHPLDADNDPFSTPRRVVGASPVAYRGRGPRSETRAEPRLSGTANSVAAAIARLRSGSSSVDGTAEVVRPQASPILPPRTPTTPQFQLQRSSATPHSPFTGTAPGVSGVHNPS